jgi:hypothetical protein
MDHVPLKIVFWGKRRPTGLEMPACDACNQGTRKLDQVAGLFARITVSDKSSREQGEFARIAESVSRCFPGWYNELAPNPKQQDAFRESFGARLGNARPANMGPLAQDALYIVGAKIGFALHYHHTGKIVPPDGFVEARYKTNSEVYRDGLPPELTKDLGPAAVLAQGIWTSDGHFAYRAGWSADANAGIYVAHLGRGFMTISFVVFDPNGVPRNRFRRK